MQDELAKTLRTVWPKDMVSKKVRNCWSIWPVRGIGGSKRDKLVKLKEDERELTPKRRRKREKELEKGNDGASERRLESQKENLDELMTKSLKRLRGPESLRGGTKILDAVELNGDYKIGQVDTLEKWINENRRRRYDLKTLGDKLLGLCPTTWQK